MRLPRWICHQIPERCFVVNGICMPLCSRCFGLYISMIFGFLISLIFNLGGLFNKIQMLIIGFLMCSPLALDGTTQLFKWRESNNKLRFITGILAGFFCGVGTHYLLLKIF